MGDVMPKISKNRYTFAAVISPLIPAVIALAPMLGGENPQFEMLAVALALLTSYLGLFVIGLPLVFLLERIGWLNLPVLSITGALAGIGVLALFLQGLGAILESSAPINTIQILWGAGLGFSAALSFGLISGIIG